MSVIQDHKIGWITPRSAEVPCFISTLSLEWTLPQRKANLFCAHEAHVAATVMLT